MTSDFQHTWSSAGGEEGRSQSRAAERLEQGPFSASQLFWVVGGLSLPAKGTQTSQTSSH